MRITLKSMFSLILYVPVSLINKTHKSQFLIIDVRLVNRVKSMKLKFQRNLGTRLVRPRDETSQDNTLSRRIRRDEIRRDNSKGG